jgi:choline dehydrogenase
LEFRRRAESALEWARYPILDGKGPWWGVQHQRLSWSRGHQADWDYYAAESGDASWGYEAVLDLYRCRIEAWAGNADPDYRGSGGMVHVQPAADPHPFSFALLVGAESVELQRFPNANGRLMESSGGCAFVDETVYQGTRRSIFRSYLHPRTANTNVTVVTGALVTRVLFDRRRATGIEFHCQGKNLRATAGCEVVLCLGAIQTPKLLMQSGIGDEDELRRAGIPLVHKLPAVGRHLHDHVAFGCVWESSGSPPPSAPRSQTVCFWKIDAALDAPDFYAFARRGPDVTPENAALLDLPADSWSFVIGMRPRSRGRVHLTGPDANDPVKIDANYLSDPDDLGNLMTGLDVARAIGNSVALRPFTAREIAPAARTDDELERFLRNGLGTFWHQCGTARMGRDENSVVDGRLKVHGLDGLRVADASILPRVTTGNTMAPCVVIGEQVAAFLQVTSS